MTKIETYVQTSRTCMKIILEEQILFQIYHICNLRCQGRWLIVAVF